MKIPHAEIEQRVVEVSVVVGWWGVWSIKEALVCRVNVHVGAAGD